MTESLFPRNALKAAVKALRDDLIDEDGPRISTMRNYRFAILCYPPDREFELRQEVNRLSGDLSSHGWQVLPISLQKLLLDRIRSRLNEDELAAMIAREKRTSTRDPTRALNYVRDKIAPHIEGKDGIAADVAKEINDFTDANPDKVDRTLALIGRAGALYPFFRSSALLKHLDGRTRNVPVVLLYPGERRGESGLSFMGVLEADRDYRPRIYG